ncbi:TonB-dependent receptor [Sphingomonas bacterium]|uniref:TonB-dependent receptor n=1 Tax=Sphingomonas bacterium TaxID=1895847 RepID=UPI001575AF9E|nr:TonB-dependent receptor [Sphingomonas bacterium]
MKLAASASVAVLSFLLAGQAFAQVVSDPQAHPQQPSSTGPAASNPVSAGTGSAAPAEQTTGAVDSSQDTGQIGDIVVTATRRETNLQSTPISISVLNTQALEDRHVLSLFNLADGSVPSLRVATFEARQSALTIGIRGIVPYDQNQTARDNGVGVYIDGIALGKTQGLNAALFDIERIEVLKGPQGTLFGRNTEGGALSLVTKAPTGVFDGRVVGGVGNFGSHNAEIHLDLPSFYNISLKIDGVYQHQDPTVKDPLQGSTGWNYYDRKGGRIASRWEPLEGLTADFAFDYARDDNTPMFSQLLNYNPNGYNVGNYAATSATNATPVLYYNGTRCNVAIAATAAVNPGGVTNPCIAPKSPIVGVHPGRQYVADVGVPQQQSTDKTHGASASFKYKLSPEIELRSITAWRGVHTDQYDNSGGPERTPFAPSFTGENLATSNSGKFSRYSLSFLRQHQFSQEFQAVGSIPQLDYVAGLYYFEEHATEYAATPTTNLWNLDGTGYTILSPIVLPTVSSTNQGVQVGSQFVTRNSTANDHNYSAFGQATYTPDFLETVHITAGGRYTKDKRHGTLYTVNNLPTNFTFANETNRFDPLVNVLFDATPDIHLYAKYSTGFRAGGADDRSQRFDSFGPESVKSYEIGAKMDLFDHRARVNVAGYIENRRNTQFDFDLFDTDPASPTVNSHLEEAINAQGTNHIRGVEIDGTIKPIRQLTLSGSYAYTYFDQPTATNPLTGVTQSLFIVYTPKHAASGAIDYVMPVNVGSASVRLHLDANYASKQYSFEAEPTKTDSSFIVNGRLALADIAVTDRNKVTVSVWTRNLFDRTYIYRRSDANSSPVRNFNGPNLASTAYGGILGDYGNLNTPRTWGLELAAKF